MADYRRVLVCIDEINGTNGVNHYRESMQRELVDSATSDPFIEKLIAMNYCTGEGGTYRR